MSHTGVAVPIDAILDCRLAQVRQLLEGAESARDHGDMFQCAVRINMIGELDISIDDEKMDILDVMTMELTVRE